MLDKGTNTLENVIILIDRIIFIRKIILLDFVTNMTFDDPISSFPTNFKEHVSTNLGLKTCVLKKLRLAEISRCHDYVQELALSLRYYPEIGRKITKRHENKIILTKETK